MSHKHNSGLLNVIVPLQKNWVSKDSIIQEIAEDIYDLTNLPKKGNPFTYDAFLAAGENNNAKLIAAYFNQNGLEARYIHPKEAGITVTAEPSNARILPSSYDKIEELKDSSEVIVIPGFFGVTQDGDICTFSRGGSDITGSIIAAGVKADLYEKLYRRKWYFCSTSRYY